MRLKRIAPGFYTVQIGGKLYEISRWPNGEWVWNVEGGKPGDVFPSKKEAIAALNESLTQDQF